MILNATELKRRYEEDVSTLITLLQNKNSYDSQVFSHLHSVMQSRVECLIQLESCCKQYNYLCETGNYRSFLQTPQVSTTISTSLINSSNHFFEQPNLLTKEKQPLTEGKQPLTEGKQPLKKEKQPLTKEKQAVLPLHCVIDTMPDPNWDSKTGNNQLTKDPGDQLTKDLGDQLTKDLGDKYSHEVPKLVDRFAEVPSFIPLGPAGNKQDDVVYNKQMERYYSQPNKKRKFEQYSNSHTPSSSSSNQSWYTRPCAYLYGIDSAHDKSVIGAYARTQFQHRKYGFYTNEYGGFRYIGCSSKNCKYLHYVDTKNLPHETNARLWSKEDEYRVKEIAEAKKYIVIDHPR